MLALRLNLSTTALPRWFYLSMSKLVELKMLDFSDCMRTGISVLTSAADDPNVPDLFYWVFQRLI